MDDRWTIHDRPHGNLLKFLKPHVAVAVLTGLAVAPIVSFVPGAVVLPVIALVAMTISGLVALAAWTCGAKRAATTTPPGTLPAHWRLSDALPGCSASRRTCCVCSMSRSRNAASRAGPSSAAAISDWCFSASLGRRRAMRRGPECSGRCAS